MVPPHSSYRQYLRGCRCGPCTACNTYHQKQYRIAREANFGLPLNVANRKIPSLMTRLRREIGIIDGRRFTGE